MSSVDLEYLKYPVGKFTKPDVVIPEQIKVWIQEIKDLPDLLQIGLSGLSSPDYEKTYRPDGWNIRQLVHHLADSHMNSFIRFKLALTEENPVIKPYLEGRWSAMPDETMLQPQSSLDILSGLHTRWGFMLDHMAISDFQKGFIHPEKNRFISLEETTALYAWHCRHHLAHIRIAKHS
ncbi:MAG: YfiT family bacillithiol transferase [Saprospiraceae bacterium]